MAVSMSIGREEKEFVFPHITYDFAALRKKFGSPEAKELAKGEKTESWEIRLSKEAYIARHNAEEWRHLARHRTAFSPLSGLVLGELAAAVSTTIESTNSRSCAESFAKSFSEARLLHLSTQLLRTDLTISKDYATSSRLFHLGLEGKVEEPLYVKIPGHGNQCYDRLSRYWVLAEARKENAPPIYRIPDELTDFLTALLGPNYRDAVAGLQWMAPRKPGNDLLREVDLMLPADHCSKYDRNFVIGLVGEGRDERFMITARDDITDKSVRRYARTFSAK